LESGLREAASLPTGTVEVLVCDNASSDETPDLISTIRMAHPELRTFRNDENLGFDRNYLRCVEEALGEFVWVMGDDDVWLPGSVTRVLRELDAGADACLCLAEVCDIELNPKHILSWYNDPNPPKVWPLESPDDLVRYFNTCAYNAGVFAFISVGIFRRERFLENRDPQQRDLDSGYIHVWSMMKSFRRPLRLHYIPEVLIQNRLTDAVSAGTEIFNRLMLDFRGFGLIADAVFGDDARIHDAFSRIVGRNHDDGFNVLPWIRLTAPSEAAWVDAEPFLIRAGYSPARIAAVEFGIHKMHGQGFPITLLDHGTRPFVDLAFLVERSRSTAILALGGRQNIHGGAALLTALQKKEGGPLRIFCPPDCLEILDGFDVQPVDPRRYAGDAVYRESIVKTMLNFSPALAVNLDPARGIEADDLMAATLPAGAIAYELPDRGQDAELRRAVNSSYTCLIPKNAGPGALLNALGLESATAILC
jgi:abequosyltransferase